MGTRLAKEYKSLFRLGLPVFVTQVCIIMVSFADTMMVGAYGLDELAASAFVNSLFLVAVVMLMGFAGGVTPLIGALFSRGDDFSIGHTLRSSLRLNVGMGVLFTAVMASLYPFLGMMGQPPELLPLIRSYYLVVLGTLIPSSVFSCCQQVANGVTDTSSPMWVILGANVANVLGNYCLIFGHFGMPELGLTGAGISTLVARAGSAVVMYAIVTRGSYRRYNAGFYSGGGCGGCMRRVWRTSYPVMLQSGVECMLWSFGAVVCGWFGVVQLAAYQVVNTIGQLGFMIYMSFGVAISVRVANYMGLKDFTGIRRTTLAGLHITVLLATAASFVFLVAGKPLIGLFNDSEEVLISGGALIIPLILYQYCDAVQLTYANAQRGTSDARPLLWASLISYVCIGIPVMLLLAVTSGMGNTGVYYSFSVALLSAALLLRHWFRRTLRRAAPGANAQRPDSQ